MTNDYPALKRWAILCRLASRDSGANCFYLLERMCEWLNGKDFEPRPGLEIPYSVLKAILAHLYLAWIHPFGDGNGRTARLVEFQILIGSGVPAPAAHLLSNHYNLTRTEYYRQLDLASKTGGDVLPFVSYALQGFIDGLMQQIAYIRQQQFDVMWRYYVHEVFTGHSITDKRRRDLVLDLSSQRSPVLANKIPEISSRLASSYATLHRTTIQRDLNVVHKMNLVVRKTEGYTANTDLIKAFFPKRAEIKEKKQVR